MDRILLVKLSSLGDLFHAVPAAEQLQTHFACPVDWVTQPEYVPIVECHQNVSRVIPFPRRGGAGAWRTFRRELQQESYDLVVDLQGLFKSGLACRAAKAKRVVGCSYPRECVQWFWDEAPAKNTSVRHAVDRIIDTLDYLGVPRGALAYPLDFPKPAHLPEVAGPVVAMAPKSRWPGKDWPLSRFVETGERLLREGRADSIWILGGPDDAEACAELSGKLGEQAFNLCGKISLLELGGALAQVDVLLCNDSGPMHFSAAVNKPVVALFGPTDPDRTGPYGPQHTVLRPPPEAGGYPDHRSFKTADASFISRITVEEVYAAITAKLVQG